MAMTNEEIGKWLYPVANQYGNGMFGPSFTDSYRNAAAQRRRLGELEIGSGDNQISQEDFDAFNAGFKAQQGQAIAGGITAGLTGATTMLTGAMQSAQIQDTSMQEGMIDDLYRAGNYNYNNYDQLANDYAQTDFNHSFGYQDIRGMNDWQKAGAIGSSTLTGATTGLQIGGPWGALIGGVIGAGVGTVGVLSGDTSAKTKQRALNLQADFASEAAQQNFAAAHERIGDNIHRQQAVNVVANGGQLRKQSLKEYADKVLLSHPRQRDARSTSGITRIRKDGGVTIRIKK